MDKPPAPSRGPLQGLLKLACPQCAASGLIPWGRLQSLLYCSGCQTWYRVGGDGKLQESLAPNASSTGALRLYLPDGEERFVAIPAPADQPVQTRWSGLRLATEGFLVSWRFWLGLTCSLGILSVAVLFLGRPVKPRYAALPKELEPRTQLLTEAWLAKDMTLLIQLADPVQDRKVRRWVMDHPAPVLTGPFNRRANRFEITVLKREAREAEVEVRIAALDSGAITEPIVLRTQWIDREGNWLFSPPAPIIPAKTRPRR